jgi:parallel beta-helix repeat protein
VKNGENGLLVNAFIRKTEVKISKNTFCENEFNGLLINGRFNNCIVQGNVKITGNMKSGICVNGLAFPVIKQNKIYCNLHQGVLVCDDACASIEENKIYSNLKANVAFGGETGLMTRVINNDIYRARSEGIFCIDSAGGLIARNRIFENNDGIVLFNAKNIEVSENDIMNNVRSGCLIGAESEPKMFQNQVKENKFIGIMFRDGSKGEYFNNIIENNPTQCYYTNSCKDLIDTLEEKNKINGRIDTETGCNIF